MYIFRAVSEIIAGLGEWHIMESVEGGGGGGMSRHCTDWHRDRLFGDP